MCAALPACAPPADCGRAVPSERGEHTSAAACGLIICALCSPNHLPFARVSEISLEIGIQKSPSGIFFNIEVTGVSFEPDNYTEPVLRDLIKEKKKGSLGLVLVQRVMDEVTFRQEKSRNVCRMVKFLQLTDH